MPRLSGADFVAIVRISNRENETLAAVGQTCERVPANALESLERRGRIKRAPQGGAEAVAPPSGQRKERES